MILSTCNRVEVALTCEENGHSAWRWMSFWPTRARPARMGDAVSLPLRRQRGDPASVPRGRQPGFDGGRRAADSGTAQVRLFAGQGARRRQRIHGRAAHPRVQRRQARALGNRHRRERRFHQLRGGGAGARNLRFAARQESHDRRRGQDVRTGGPASAAQRRWTNPGHQPHPRARSRNGGAVRWQAGRLHALSFRFLPEVDIVIRIQRRAALHHRARRHEEGAGSAPQQARCS
jgi:hypothetical protein